MSLEKAKEFFEKIEKDETLAAAYKAMVVDSQSLSKEEATSRVIEFANAKGFDITKEDIETIVSEKEELSDDDLDAVAGGKLSWNIFSNSDYSNNSFMICFIAGYKS